MHILFLKIDLPQNVLREVFLDQDARIQNTCISVRVDVNDNYDTFKNFKPNKQITDEIVQFVIPYRPFIYSNTLSSP